MTTVGPNWCGTGANQSGGNQWTSPTNIQGSGTGSVTFASQTTTTLICTNFGFSIPANAVVDGLTLVVYSGSLSANTNLDNSVQLRNAGTPFGTDKASGTVWPSGVSSRTYGGSTDNWGGITAAQVNSSTFGVGLSYKPFFSGGTMNLDRVSITVDYHIPAVEVDLTLSADGTSTPVAAVTTQVSLAVPSSGAATPAAAFITTPRLSSSSSGVAVATGSLRSPERLLLTSGGVAASSSNLYAPSLMGLLSASGVASPTAALFAYSLLGSLTVSGVAVTTLALASPYLFTVSASGLASVSGQVASRVLLLVNSSGTSTAIATLREDMPIVAAGSSSASSVLIAPVVLPVGAGGVGALSGALVSPARLTATAGGTGTPTTTLFARSLLGALSASGVAAPSGGLSSAAPLLAASNGAASDSLLISTSYFTILSVGTGLASAAVGTLALFLLEADGVGSATLTFYGGISGINVSKRFNAGYVRDDGFLGGYVVRRRGV